MQRPSSAFLLAVALVGTGLVYAPGLTGGWFFDDYPNIVRNPDVQPTRWGVAELVGAALSSPASDLKRPLASLSFAANAALFGLEPLGWKLTNLAIHLANGWLVFLLALALFKASALRGRANADAERMAALIAAAWLLLPINLTAVLYVVQRMESLANLFVLVGLLGYVHGRLRMQSADDGGFSRCVASLLGATAAGLLAKETAILLPLYAAIVEAVLFRFRTRTRRDRRVVILFAAVLVLPGLVGAAVLVPWLADDATWATRDFTLATRLLSEARIVTGYVVWTLLPLPRELSFYHDDFTVSTGLFAPWTTAAAMLALLGLAAAAWHLRDRLPLASIGIALYLGCHLLTGSVLPLELIYEHRNYFASFGLLLAVVPALAAPSRAWPLATRILLAALLLGWSGLTLATAYAWGDPLRLAAELAARAPHSPRAQFGYGRELLARSGYGEQSPLLAEGFAVLEHAAAMPGASALPEQTMILTRSLMRTPADDRWWDSLVAKLAARAPRTENVDALGALTRCARDGRCELPAARMDEAFDAAEAHLPRNPKLLVVHSDWAWNVVGDRGLGKRLVEEAVAAHPGDAEARITLAHMNLVLRDFDGVRRQIEALERMNTAGRLDPALDELRRLLGGR
ncbi:MAG: hypothetical protein ACTHK2_13670 [Dokdonella sp.]|uniref:hypothetical protein n=1 Tax=Dokdonella sp. TaxID=2291710 RepID=UPI003F811155